VVAVYTKEGSNGKTYQLLSPTKNFPDLGVEERVLALVHEYQHSRDFNENQVLTVGVSDLAVSALREARAHTLELGVYERLREAFPTLRVDRLEQLRSLLKEGHSILEYASAYVEANKHLA